MNTADGRQAPRLTLAIVGGASGVGKSTLLGALDSTQQSSTGTLFKNRMTLATRDEVRSSHWPDYEEAVTEDLRSEVIETLARAESAVIDTHFAAKTPGGEYRIGLRADLLVQLGTAVSAWSELHGRSLSVKVILARCDPQALLRRRRLDKNRSRELNPADCFNALRENDHCSLQYIDAFRRAVRAAGMPGHRVTSHTIENDDLALARAQLVQLMEE